MKECGEEMDNEREENKSSAGDRRGEGNELRREMDGLVTAGVRNMEKKGGEMPGSEAASCLILV